MPMPRMRRTESRQHDPAIRFAGSRIVRARRLFGGKQT